MELLSFYKGKRVFVTGHSGFKGTWLCRILLRAGATVTGYALAPPTDPSLFELTKTGEQMQSLLGDVRDGEALARAMKEARPEIVFHLAAQPIVRLSYENPLLTYETNVMGTVHLFEALRQCESAGSLVNVTTDKVYENREWVWGYRESDPLNGYDPYSNSKSCSELVTDSYRSSFFGDGRCAISSARAGNVIGGGDYARDRIIPDCVRAAKAKKTIVLRHPESIRPYQHVLEPLSAYLLLARKQAEEGSLAGAYNVGPMDSECLTSAELADLFCRAWGEGLRWESQADHGPHEASFLKLDSSKIRVKLGWKSRWGIREGIEKTVDFEKRRAGGESPDGLIDEQIERYFDL